jgi:glycosyltransferase involved in cell wall biosynthesis
VNGYLLKLIFINTQSINLENKIKILYISHSPYLNGAEICLYKLIKNINKDIFDPVVVFPEHGPLVEKFRNMGIKTYILPLERWIRFKNDIQSKNTDMFSRSQNIVKIIENESIDLVHTNTSVILEGAIAAKLKGIPHIWHIHEFLNGHTDLISVVPLPVVYFAMSFLSDKIISVSDFTRSQFEPINDNRKFTVLYNGIEENNISASNNIFPDYQENNNEIIAVTIGLLTEAKGFNNLIETAALVRNKGRKIKFYWIGEAFKSPLQKFKLKIKKLGLKDSVIFLGFKSNIQEVLKSADLLISFSQNEALPTVILEAMAAEKAVIATNCGGTSECVIDGVTGYLVPVDNPVEMSNKIIELTDDSQKRKSFGENGLKRFRENFNIKTYKEKIEKLYLDVYNEKSQKLINEKEKTLIKAFLQMYEQISKYSWKYTN